jgi:hypothetical protein
MTKQTSHRLSHAVPHKAKRKPQGHRSERVHTSITPPISSHAAIFDSLVFIIASAIWNIACGPRQKTASQMRQTVSHGSRFENIHKNHCEQITCAALHWRFRP